MSKIVKFPADFYDMGEVKFAAGQFYALNSETQSLVNTGYAELVDAKDEEDIDALEALAKIAQDRADAAMTEAKALGDEAKAAAALVKTVKVRKGSKPQAQKELTDDQSDKEGSSETDPAKTETEVAQTETVGDQSATADQAAQGDQVAGGADCVAGDADSQKLPSAFQ